MESFYFSKYRRRGLALFTLWTGVFSLTTAGLYLFIGIPRDSMFLITNLLVMALSFLGAGWRPFSYFSLIKVVLIFFYFFFGVVPLVNSIEGNIYWGASPTSVSAQVFTNLIIIAGILSFVFGGLFSKRIKLKRQLKSFVFNRFKVCIFLIFSALVFFIYFYLIDFNFSQMMFRGVVGEGVKKGSDSLAAALLINNVLRYIPFIAFFLVLVESRFFKSRSFQIKILILLFSVIAIVSASPTGVSRYVVATLYIPMVILCTRLWHGAYRMQASLIFGLLIVMPFLNKFRYFDWQTFSWSVSLSSFREGHFDAYQNFSVVVERDWITWGEQLMGVFFFFVPRSIWPSKPVGSGAQLAHDLGFSFSNISMPYIAEFYLNFSLVGVFIGMLILGFVLGSLDKTYWSLSEDELNRPFSVYYYLLFGLIFFMMRGDLMSSFAYLVGLSISFLVTFSFFILIFKSKVRSRAFAYKL